MTGIRYHLVPFLLLFFFTTTISMQQKFEIYNLKACVHFCTFVYIQTFTAVEDPYKKNGGSDSIFIEP